jgi:hypothetical protein
MGSDGGGGEDHRGLIHTMIAIGGSIERQYRPVIQMEQWSYTKA